MATTTPQPQMGLTFEQVWAALMETRARQEEFAVEQRKTEEAINKMVEERRKTDEQQRKTEEAINKMSEERRKTDEQQRRTEEAINKMSERVDRVTANVGGLNRSMGELIETLIAARLWEKFDAYPYNLKRAYQRVPLFDENNRVLTDIDILLSDTGFCMAVEVKAQLNKQSDVDHHLRRMERILKYPPAECKGKILLGAMAGGSVDADVLEYAHNAGFFVLELTGESVQLADTPDGFAPRQW